MGLEPHNKGKCGEESLLKSRAFLIPLIPAKTVAMATVAREVCSIDKSATEDEGVDRSFWRSLTPFCRRTVVSSQKLMPYADGVQRLTASDPILSL